ncbi:MAG: ATP-binding region ATPase domain protein [Gemmatimonadetes bacterium]|nr:ATP-binding region ATPase domain protein [Gemmatimonadota bacterium]
MAVREIVHAFLTAERPEDVFQFALDRVSPLVGSTFACIYVVDGASELMRLAAVYNWPERWAPFLGEMRVRVGFGPSGEAASERRAIEVPDVFADPSLEDWQEVANELGFRSLVALPLQTGDGVLGTVTFYFAEAGAMSAETRNLLRMVADQMAATAQKARLIDDLRRTNAALQDSNAELEAQYVALLEARRLKDEFLANMSHELRTPLTAVMGYISLMEEGLAGPITDEQRRQLYQVKQASQQLLAMIGDLLELTSLKRGGLSVTVSRFDAREPMREAVSATPGRQDGVVLSVSEGDEPATMESDHRKVSKLLGNLLGNAFKFTQRGTVHVATELAGDRVVYRIEDTGIGIDPGAQGYVFDEFRQGDGSMTRRYGGSGLGLSIARRLARLLGGDIMLTSTPGSGTSLRVELPLQYEPSLASQGEMT